MLTIKEKKEMTEREKCGRTCQGLKEGEEVGE